MLALPGGPRLHADTGNVVIKVATMVPRTQDIVVQEKRYNQRLTEASNGRIQFKTYYGGSAGDDQTVMRKLKIGQIDAAPLGTDVVAHWVHQCTILMAPQTYFNWAQVDAVRSALSPEFNDEAYKNGFKVMSWWDAGQVRIFSRKPIKNFADLRSARPWLYPESALLKEFYQMINVTGVPLPLSEVYSGLMTKMIDTVWISSVIGTAFRWSTETQFVSSMPVNVVQGAFVLRREVWDAFSKEDQKTLTTILDDQAAKTQSDFRRDDDKTYKKLQTRGITAVDFDNKKDWEDAGKKLRQKMVGRSYSKELLARVEAITAKYANAK
jgi:TRAP-type C4-dicarboxylate transport system substrate-binding protein